MAGITITKDTGISIALVIAIVVGVYGAARVEFATGANSKEITTVRAASTLGDDNLRSMIVLAEAEMDGEYEKLESAVQANQDAIHEMQIRNSRGLTVLDNVQQDLTEAKEEQRQIKDDLGDIDDKIDGLDTNIRLLIQKLQVEGVSVGGDPP